jgi:hypothetical protein
MKCFICHAQLPNVFDTCWTQVRNVVQFFVDSILEPILEESILEESILEGSTKSAKSPSPSTKFHIIDTVYRRFAINEFKKNYDLNSLMSSFEELTVST